MRFAADENFDGKILKKLRLLFPDLDVVRVQDTEMYQQPDPAVLEWAAQENRIILTHDVQTLVGDAYARVEQGLPMAGVICTKLRREVSLWLSKTRKGYHSPMTTIAELARTMQTLLTTKADELAKKRTLSSENAK